MRGISLLAENQLASQDELCSMEQVSKVYIKLAMNMEFFFCNVLNSALL